MQTYFASPGIFDKTTMNPLLFFDLFNFDLFNLVSRIDRLLLQAAIEKGEHLRQIWRNLAQ